MMGWPDQEQLRWGHLKEKERRSLIGEGIHAACSAAVLMAIYVEDRAPWWEGIEDAEGVADAKKGAKAESIADTPPLPEAGCIGHPESLESPPKRARRTGAMRPALGPGP